MKKNIILESDSFYPERLTSWLNETGFQNTFNLYILIRPERKQRFQEELSAFESITVVSYQDFFEYKSPNNLDLSVYHDFNAFFFNDNHAARFLDREGYFPHYGIGVQNAFAYYSDVSYNLLSFLKDKKIDLVYFRNTPHEFIEHLFGKATEYLNIELITSEQHAFPWIFTLTKGISKERDWIFKDKRFEDKNEIESQIKNFVKKLNGKYEDAIPLYEKERLGKGVFKHYNPFLNPLYMMSRPQKLWCMTRNFMFYKKHSKRVDFKSTKYILFFLHYQPERSTLPEGYGFEDQFYAIKILSKLLPKDVRIVVKEHPSMFSRGSEFKIRSIYNYKSILQLQNVDLCKLDMDNFQMIDHALAVSTITGTVGLESYVRKVPVILFGRTILKVEGVHAFSTIDNLKIYIDKLIQGRVIIKNVVKNLVELCSIGTFSGLDDETPVLDDLTKKRYKTNAHLKSLNALFKSDLI